MSDIDGPRRLRRPHERGSAVVEAALVIPILLLLVMSVLEFGRLFYAKITVENAVRQAARFAITGNVKDDPNNPGNNLPRAEAIKQYLINHAPAVQIDKTKITVDPPDGGAPGQIVKVTVEHTFDFVTPLIGAFFPGGQYKFRYTTTTKNEPAFTGKKQT